MEQQQQQQSTEEHLARIEGLVDAIAKDDLTFVLYYVFHLNFHHQSNDTPAPSTGLNALQTAVFSPGRPRVRHLTIHVLLNHGADPSTGSPSALALAERRGDAAMVDILQGRATLTDDERQGLLECRQEEDLRDAETWLYQQGLGYIEEEEGAAAAAAPEPPVESPSSSRSERDDAEVAALLQTSDRAAGSTVVEDGTEDMSLDSQVGADAPPPRVKRSPSAESAAQHDLQHHPRLTESASTATNNPAVNGGTALDSLSVFSSVASTSRPSLPPNDGPWRPHKLVVHNIALSMSDREIIDLLSARAGRVGDTRFSVKYSRDGDPLSRSVHATVGSERARKLALEAFNGTYIEGAQLEVRLVDDDEDMRSRDGRRSPVNSSKGRRSRSPERRRQSDSSSWRRRSPSPRTYRRSPSPPRRRRSPSPRSYRRSPSPRRRRSPSPRRRRSPSPRSRRGFSPDFRSRRSPSPYSRARRYSRSPSPHSSNKVFLQGLPSSIAERQLWDLINPIAVVEGIRVMHNALGATIPRFAIVQLRTSSAVQAVIRTMDRKRVDGSTITAAEYRAPRNEPTRDPRLSLYKGRLANSDPPSTNPFPELHVSHLPPRASSQDVISLFKTETFEVVSCQLRSAHSEGQISGFVTLSNAEACRAAIRKLDGIHLMGSALTVVWARSGQLERETSDRRSLNPAPSATSNSNAIVVDGRPARLPSPAPTHTRSNSLVSSTAPARPPSDDPPSQPPRPSAGDTVEKSRIESLNLSHADLESLSQLWTPIAEAPQPDFDRTIACSVTFGFLSRADAEEALKRPPVFDDPTKQARYEEFLHSQAGTGTNHYMALLAQLDAYNSANTLFAQQAREAVAASSVTRTSQDPYNPHRAPRVFAKARPSAASATTTNDDRRARSTTTFATTDRVARSFA